MCSQLFSFEKTHLLAFINVSYKSSYKKVKRHIKDKTKMNHIRANFYSSKDIDKCEKCNCDIDNVHLFKFTRRNIKKNINYNHISNGTVLEQKDAIDYINNPI